MIYISHISYVYQTESENVLTFSFCCLIKNIVKFMMGLAKTYNDYISISYQPNSCGSAKLDLAGPNGQAVKKLSLTPVIINLLAII